MSELDDPPSLILPMTSITDAPGASDASQPWVFYLSVIAEQANIALRHLLSIWAMEGDTPDVDFWSHPDRYDEHAVWSHLQGSMFAGVIIARMLDPKTRSLSKKASAPQREAHNAKAAASEHRGAHLRKLLKVKANSPLLAMRKVRDSLEHIDERIDEIVAKGDVASVSDFSIAIGGRFTEIPAEPTKPGQRAVRHVPMRQFSPDLGALYFGEDCIDLFEFETALHSVVSNLPEAFSAAGTTAAQATYGTSKPLIWNSGASRNRREAIEQVRREVKEAGDWLLHLSSPPRTVVFAMRQPKHVDSQGSTR